MGPSIGQVLSWWAGGQAENPLGASCKVKHWDPESNHYRLFYHISVAQLGGDRKWGAPTKNPTGTHTPGVG